MDKSVTRVAFLVVASFGGAMLLWAWTAAIDSPSQRAQTDLCGPAGYVPGSCTIFAISRGQKVYFGNKEDWTFPKPICWVEPPREGRYGSVYLGFNSFNPQGGVNEPCPRSEKATEMLGRIQAESDLTPEALRAVVDAVHVEGPGINTLYSNVVDLKRRIIYLYYWHQYGEVATLDVMQEIAKRPKPTPLRDLFAKETVEQASAEPAKYKGQR